MYRVTTHYAKTRYWRRAKAAGAANLRLKVANSRIESLLYLCLKFVGSYLFKRNLFTALEWQQINHLTNAWTVYIRGWSPPWNLEKTLFWNHCTAGSPSRRARSQKIGYSCMEQWIEQDTFNQMKIIRDFLFQLENIIIDTCTSRQWNTVGYFQG